MEKNIFFLLATIATGMSLLSSFVLILSLNSKKSTYAKLMQQIVISESIYIFSQFMIIRDHDDYFAKLFYDILNLITFDKIDQNFDLIKIFRYSTYFALQSHSLWFSVFMCLEIILILKNPLSQIKTRMNFYYLISGISAICTFILSAITITLKENRKSDFFLISIPTYYFLI
jgi:hypothetical protein